LARELATQHAEEVDRARSFHVGLGWRVAIGTCVAAYAGFLSLHILRVLTALSSGTWGTGLAIVLCAVAGAWVGAVLPAWVERAAGRRATAKVRTEAEGVAAAHVKSAQETYKLLQGGDKIQLELRKLAIQRRTWLLANRAWHIVRSTLEELRRSAARRRLLIPADRLVNKAERLELEDRREWRDRSVLGISIPLHTDGVDVSDEFTRSWKSALQTEDRDCTGFLRAGVLRHLVRELDRQIVESIESQMLDNGTSRLDDLLSKEEKEGELIKAKLKTAYGAGDWCHPLLSVDDSLVAERAKGEHWFFAQKNCRFLADAAKSVLHEERLEQPPEGLPIHALGLYFHCVNLQLHDDGRLTAGTVVREVGS
jgi:hypothetical protein